jgi:hypothetical protein
LEARDERPAAAALGYHLTEQQTQRFEVRAAREPIFTSDPTTDWN